MPGSNKDILEVLDKVFKVLEWKSKELEVQIKKINDLRKMIELNHETLK